MRITPPSLGRLGDRATHLFRRQPGDDAQLLDHCPQGEALAGELAGEAGQAVDDGAGAVLAGVDGVDHGGLSPGGDAETVAEPLRGGLWKAAPRFHKDITEGLTQSEAVPAVVRMPTAVGKTEALLGFVEKAARPAARLINRNRPDGLSYAMTAAVNALGVKEVSEVTGLSKSAIYAGCDAQDVRGFPSLPFETALRLSMLMNRKGGRGEVFALPFLLRSAEARAPVAHSAHLLHQASHVTALYGRTAAALCKLFDRAENAHKPVPIDPRERDEAVAAIDAAIEGLAVLKSQLLTSTCLPPLFPSALAEETAP